MSTQAEPGIEFSIVPEENRQRFRLLELPPDLLSFISSDDPPILHLKSQEGPPGNALDSTAVLCAADQTYTLRQVSTSNEVYLAQSLSSTNAPQSRLEAIAKCDSTLEVQPAKNLSAVPYIKAALPTFTTTGHYDSKETITRTQLFANIPLSDEECSKAWLNLACFELGDPLRAALIPSNSMKLEVWGACLTSFTARSFDFAGRVDVFDIETIAQDLLEWPAALIAAVVFSMCIKEDYQHHIDETKCARMVGEMLLRDHTEDGRSATSVRSFIAAWADLLPEKWRSRAEVTLLEGSYILENGGQDVMFVESRVTDGSDGTTGAPADANASLGAKRKWHEKFRASKKTS